MTSRSAHLLALVALVMLMASGPAFAQTIIDYDLDNNGYIDVSTHAQLNAIRYDLNGDGNPTILGASTYNNVFPNRDGNAATRMGCPSGNCVGYELTANIDLDTDGDGSANSADAYWNSGQGWSPIGSDASPALRYTGDFKGNGYTVQNLFISRSTVSYQALFGGTGTNSRIESLGVTDADVTADDFSAILVGANRGEIVACYTTGSITGDNVVGGLVGWTGGAVSTSYSLASVSATERLGGLVGSKAGGGSITNSYSTGAVSLSSGSMTSIGGLLGESNAGTGTVSDSYWDTTTSGRTTSFGGSGAAGKTTSDLQSPTTYGATTNDTYYNWNANIDGQPGNDDPWTFGTTKQYPALKFAGMDTTSQFAAQPVNYDTDSDGLLEVSTLAQLHAIRWDINGNGFIDASASTADTTAYNAAFPNGNLSASKGCPSTGCIGYELLNNLDFDENSDGRITSADATYWNSGAGWQLIGSDANSASRYQVNFKGNGYTINNLFINRSGGQGLFGAIHSTSRIETLGVTNANVTGGDQTGILVGTNYGKVVACYTTGSVSGGQFVGGLAGFMGIFSASLIHSSYSTASVSGNRDLGGLVGRGANNGAIRNSYSIGNVSGTTATRVGGLIGRSNITVANSYWNTSTSNRPSSAAGTGRTTAQLQSPTTYGATTSDTYYGWNANLDGQPGNDDPWTFGAMDQYPVLKYAGMDTTVQFQLQPARVTLALTPSTISESGGMSTVTATLAHPSSAITTITVRPVAGAYTVPADSTITIPAGQTANASDTVVITAVNNTQDAPNRNVTVTFVAGNAQGVGSVTGATLTLEDDEPAPTATLAASPSSISENGAVSTITATLSHSSSAATTITVRPVPDAYSVGSDSTITIAAGSTANATDTVVITAVNNTQDAPNRNVTVSGVMSNAQGAGSVTGALTITDDDAAPDVTLTLMPATISENGAVSTITASLSRPSSAATTITVRPVADAYTVGSDSTITIAAGQTANASDTVVITAVDNTQDAPNRDVTVTVVAGNAQGVGSVTGAALTLEDDDAAPDVTLVLMPATISENGAVSTITASLSRPSSAATTITVRPVAGAYTVPADSTITIASGNTANASDTVIITAVDNTQDELNRDVTVTVVADNAQGSVVLPTEITITDDDPQPRFSISSPSAVEGTALTFTVRLNAASGKEVTVAYADAGTGTATSGTDYTALTAGTLTFAAGETSQTIPVSVTGDTDNEQNETVIVTLSNATNATISTAQGTGTIIDDDGMPALSIGSPSVIEGATGATLTFRVYLSPAHTAQVTVAYADAGTGTATSGTDYTALTAGTLTFAVGDTIQTIPVSVTDDSDDEPNETVIVTLSSATNATISTAQGTGTIIDDESPSANLDVDGDGRVRLFSDIILVIRYVLFFRNEALLRGNVIEPTATRTTAQDIEPYLDTLVNQNILDVDGDGDVRLFSDIILIIRYVLFFRNEALLRGNVIEQNATRTTAQAIEPYIRSLYPASHFQ